MGSCSLQQGSPTCQVKAIQLSAPSTSRDQIRFMGTAITHLRGDLSTRTPHETTTPRRTGTASRAQHTWATTMLITAMCILAACTLLCRTPRTQGQHQLWPMAMDSMAILWAPRVCITSSVATQQPTCILLGLQGQCMVAHPPMAQLPLRDPMLRNEVSLIPSSLVEQWASAGS